jgi:hypothetical protein
MRKTLLRVAVPLAILLCAAFVLVVVNQTAQVVTLADRIHPALGTALLWTLLALYVTCLIVPALLLLRLPRPLTPAASEEAPEFPRHIAALGRRLRDNPHLAGRPVASRPEIEAALSILDARANEGIRSAASRVFLATAVSQNGSLDGLLVLLMQSRMIWQVAHVYYQRPSLRDLVTLYGNVAGTALVASQLDDVDLSEQLQPVLSGVLGSVAGAIPGLQATSAILVNSMVAGAANAFLTLRVGVIAKRYCGALVVPERRALRRAAASEAAGMLAGITRDGARRVAQAFWNASRTKAADTVRGFGDSVKESMRVLVERLGFAGSSSPGATEHPETPD